MAADERSSPAELPLAERPWRVISTTRIFRGLGRTIDLERVETADGRELSWPQIHIQTGVSVVPFVDDQVVLVCQYRHSLRRVTWELPAGGMEVSETPEEAALRELHEEAAVDGGRLEALGSYQAAVGAMDGLAHYFVAFDCRETEEHRPGEEPTAAVHLPFAEALRMAKSGELDVHTAFPLLLVAERYGHHPVASS